MNTRKILSFGIALATAASIVSAIPAFADTTAQATVTAHVGGGFQGGAPRDGMGRGGGPAGMKPAVFGKVTAVSGTSLTIAGRQGFGSSTTSVTYNVDASNATVMKDNATSSLSSVATGDTVLVQGTVSGTNVAATVIRDGVSMNRGQAGDAGKRGDGTSTPAFEGNGEPVVAGSVSAVSGTTITLTNKSNVSYTVDASSAKFVEGQNSSATISNIAVGDNVVIQGTVNGTSVTATTVIDQKAPAKTTSGSDTSGNGGHPSFVGGVLGGIGSFFKHIFGF